MSEPLPHYLRTHRKRLGFSQDELAWLMGSTDGSKISRYERCIGKPSLEAVLAYEIIFAQPMDELFAGIFAAVQAVTARRAQELAGRLEKMTPTPTVTAKLAVLRRLSRSDDANPIITRNA